MKFDDEASFLKWCERWLDNGQEGTFLCFKIGKGLKDRMSGDESTLKYKIDWLPILKKELKNFEVDSNIEDVRWRNFILNSAESMLERNDEREDETASISLTVEGRTDETFSWD